MGGMLPGPVSSILRTTGLKGSQETSEDAVGLILSGDNHFGIVEKSNLDDWTLSLKPTTRPLCIKCDIS